MNINGKLIIINFVVFHKDSVVNKIICVQMNIRVDNDKIKNVSSNILTVSDNK